MTIVRVETDEGVVGVGSGDTMDGFEAFEHLFVGQDPLAIARHVRALETIDFHAGRYWPLEVALWDIAGQVAGLPVATLFGGVFDGIPAYASCGMLLPPAARAESAVRFREEGFRALKIRVDPRAAGRRARGRRRRRAHAVGDTMAIMVDLNQGWRMAGDVTPSIDFETARAIAERLAELDVLWLEEPLDGSDLTGLAALRAAVPGIKIAGGEMTRTFRELEAALEADAFDVHQPDVVLAAGMTNGRRLAERALAKGRWYSPAHVDERDRAAGEPPRGGGCGRRPVHRVPVRPAGLDPGAPRRLPGRADPAWPGWGAVRARSAGARRGPRRGRDPAVRGVMR